MLLPVSERWSRLAPRFQDRLAPGWLRSRDGRATGAWSVSVTAERRPRGAVITSTLSLVAWQQSFTTTAAMTAGRPQCDTAGGQWWYKQHDTEELLLQYLRQAKRLMKKGVVRVGQR